LSSMYRFSMTTHYVRLFFFAWHHTLREVAVDGALHHLVAETAVPVCVMTLGLVLACWAGTTTIPIVAFLVKWGGAGSESRLLLLGST
jgi:hypothetical protein